MAATAKDPWVWDTQRDELLLVASRLLAGRLSATATGDLADATKLARESAACVKLAARLLQDVEAHLGRRPFDVEGLGAPPVKIEARLHHEDERGAVDRE